MLKESLVDYDPDTGLLASPPLQVFLESTARCNLSCVHCFTDFGRRDGPKGVDLPIPVVERLRPWIKSARFVNLNGVGEPLLADNFDAILEQCAGSEAEVSFNTNGTLLTTERCDQLVAAGINSIAVSLDGMETHRSVRGVPYEFIRERIIRLDAAKRRAGRDLPHIAVAYTLMRRNVEELPRLLRDLLPLGILHGVHVQPLVVFYEGMRDQNVYLSSLVEKVLDECKEIAAGHPTILTLCRTSLPHDEGTGAASASDDAAGQLGSRSERFGCIDPFFQIQIKATGEIMACCYGLFPGLNVMETPLEEIWNAPWYRDLRRRLHAGTFPGKCHKCPLVFGSTTNQLDSLQPGLRHSKEDRFLPGEAKPA